MALIFNNSILAMMKAITISSWYMKLTVKTMRFITIGIFRLLLMVFLWTISDESKWYLPLGLIIAGTVATYKLSVS